MNRALLLCAALGCATAQRSKDGAVASFGPAGITTEAVRPLRHALLVGIDDFQDARFTPLKHAVADARELGSALAEFDDVRVLVRPEETTRSSILAELAGLESRLRTPSDTVLLYFSTHGSLGREPGGDLKRFLIASDTRKDLMSETGLSVDALKRKADAFRSRRVLVVLAACHSGKGKSQLPDELAAALASHKGPVPPPLEEVSEAVIVLTAAAFGEAAREDDKLGHDVYTYFLLRALDEGDRDGDGAVTASEAHDYARERTYAFTGGQQRPTSESNVLGRDPIVLRGHAVRPGSPVIYSYSPSAEGIAVLVNGAQKGTLPGGIALQPGLYRLRLANAHDGRVLYDGSVDVHAGDYVDLSNLVPRPTQLTADLGLGALLPVTHALRAALPSLPLALARFGLRRFPRDWMRVELEASAMTGSGNDVSFPGAQVAFRSSGARLSLAVWGEAQLGRSFSLGAGPCAGTLFLARDDQGAYSGHQSLRATTAGAMVQASWGEADRLRLGARLEALAIFGRVASSSGPHLAIVPTANASYSF